MIDDVDPNKDFDDTGDQETSKKSKEDQELLGMDRSKNEGGVRGRGSQRIPDHGSQGGNDSAQGTNLSGSGRDASVRQSAVHPTDAPGDRHQTAEHAGHGEEGEGQKPESEQEKLSSRTPANRIPQEERKEILPSMPGGERQALQTGASARVTVLQAQKDGRIVGQTLEEQYRLAKAFCASGLMPKGLSTPEKVLVAMQMCYELQLPVISSIGKVMVVNGTPSIFGELPLAIVRRSGQLEDFHEEFLTDPKTKDFIGVRCLAQRKGVKRAVEREFTMEDAKRAGLLGRDTWKSYPKRMCQYRARAWALKDLFSDILGGASIGEWDQDIGTGPELADELNQSYLAPEANGTPSA